MMTTSHIGVTAAAVAASKSASRVQFKIAGLVQQLLVESAPLYLAEFLSRQSSTVE